MRGIDAQALVSFAPPAIGDGEVEEVVAALASGWLSTGPRVHELEARFAARVGARHAVALNSGTAALHLALLAAGIGPGDEVVTTPLTFCATVNAVIHTGATPIFADVDFDTMNLSPGGAAAAVTSRTRAVLPVHFAGRPAALDAIADTCRAKGLALIEDAAHAVGASTRQGAIGSIGDLTCFSFYATKNLTTGEGGMVTTASAEHAAFIRTAALHGMSRDAWKRYGQGGAAHYEVVMAGFKYNMMDLQAAIGLRQLARFDQLQARRAAIWRRYDDGLADLPLRLPAPAEEGTTHAHHLYTVIVEADACGRTRDEVHDALRRRGVSTSIHFRALHLHPFYQERLGVRRGMFPNAERISDATLSLPLSARHTDADIDLTIGALRQVLG